MPSYCCVPNCTNSSLKPGIKIHPFPRNESLKYIWATKIGIDENISKSMGVCSFHFVQSDYFIPKHRNLVHKLKQDAVPSIFMPDTPSPKMQFVKVLSKKELDEKKKISVKLMSRLEGIPFFEKYVEKIKQNHADEKEQDSVLDRQKQEPVTNTGKDDDPVNECSLEQSLWPDGFMELDRHKRPAVPKKKKPPNKPSKKLVILFEDKANKVLNPTLNTVSSVTTKELSPILNTVSSITTKELSPILNTVFSVTTKELSPILNTVFSVTTKELSSTLNSVCSNTTKELIPTLNSVSSDTTEIVFSPKCSYKNVSKKSFSSTNAIKSPPVQRRASKRIPKNSFSKSAAKPRKRIHSELIFETSNIFKNLISAKSSENLMNIKTLTKI